MTLPPLYAVLDVDACERAGREPVAVARAFVDAGVTLLQVRMKSLGSAAMLDLARSVVCLSREVSVIVNDRADVAVLAGAAGVHLGQEDLSVIDARRLVGLRAIVGLSTHTVAQASAAMAEPVSYVAVGPVFETGTKDTGYRAVGLDLIRTVAEQARARSIPVVAIGGITLERAGTVLDAGASSVCVIADLLRGDPTARAREFLSALANRPPAPSI